MTAVGTRGSRWSSELPDLRLPPTMSSEDEEDSSLTLRVGMDEDAW